MTAHHFPVWEKRPASPSETNRKTQGPKAPRALTHSVPGGGHPGLCAFRVQFGKAGAGHRGRAESEQVGRQGRGRGQRKKPCLDTHEALAEVAPSSYTMPAGTVQGARCTEANQEVGLCARGAGGSSSWRTPNTPVEGNLEFKTSFFAPSVHTTDPLFLNTGELGFRLSLLKCTASWDFSPYTHSRVGKNAVTEGKPGGPWRSTKKDSPRRRPKQAG
ncbi:uncharacterized protein LOC122694217 isoform X1 [Cervus elaphus]|uniref:uncharacterized protein LOC122694217 isoform X1 n=1 Tax=Cervus elaphus TaxID=9860 RepID=UPI001CC329D4|nr:uncharacterized protein LOC122694217 isoform X1 [Cervus elaphus]